MMRRNRRIRRGRRWLIGEGEEAEVDLGAGEGAVDLGVEGGEVEEGGSRGGRLNWRGDRIGCQMWSGQI